MPATVRGLLKFSYRFRLLMNILAFAFDWHYSGSYICSMYGTAKFARMPRVAEPCIAHKPRRAHPYVCVYGCQNYRNSSTTRRGQKHSSSSLHIKWLCARLFACPCAFCVCASAHTYTYTHTHARAHIIKCITIRLSIETVLQLVAAAWCVHTCSLYVHDLMLPVAASSDPRVVGAVLLLCCDVAADVVRASDRLVCTISMR